MEIKNAIGALNPYQAQMARTQSNEKTDKASRGTTNASSPSKGDTVTLSPEAKLRAEANSAAMNAPELRQEKVDAIRERINSGEYTIDSRLIASRMLQEEQDFLE